ncbi:MAG TPA: YicC/YloC family endoribonuclease [Terriglobales bacterium]|nr:YicC/YloC family endoribonuclease [Terriglobales bacterium]
MPVRSMTGFAQVTGQVDSNLNFSLSLKSVNHRFLDLHFRIPADSDALEMKLRRKLKEQMARGHVELTLNLRSAGGAGFALNRELVASYIQAFRTAAEEFGIEMEPDLNAILRIPGALDSARLPSDSELDAVVLAKLDEALHRLNEMREAEGEVTDRELRNLMRHVKEACQHIEKHRQASLKTYAEKLNTRLQELIGSQIEPERVLQEAALLVDRSDIQEELVRLDNHVKHFLGLLDSGGEIGKKLDFLLQEMNREANTLLSKTSGLAGEALNITEFGLSMKSDIEKAREQVQNLE